MVFESVTDPLDSGNPSIPAVYEVESQVFGPRAAHEPKIYAYFDGVDTWSTWQFSVEDAYKANPAPGVKFKWFGGPLDMPHHTNLHRPRP